MPQIILKERTAHLVSYAFFTRDIDQYKNTSLSQLYQPPRTPFLQNILSLVTFVLLILQSFYGGSEFSSYEIELRNRVTQNDVTLPVTNWKSKNKNFYFELLTRRFSFYFSTFELLTRK